MEWLILPHLHHYQMMIWDSDSSNPEPGSSEIINVKIVIDPHPPFAMSRCDTEECIYNIDTVY